MDQTQRDAINKTAASSLKKIISSKGSIKGAFYFAADSKLKDAGVVIYLAAKGAKADSLGKKLRKAISSARFARGIVDVHNNRPIFIIHGGNAPPDLLKKACKNVLSKQDGLRFLSRALARMASEDGAEEDDLNENDADKAEIEASLALTEEEKKELADLNEEIDNDEMTETAEQLFASFLSAEESAQELDELNTERLASVEEKEKALADLTKPSDDWTAAYTELREARFAFAETNHTGPDPFPDVGDELDEGTVAVLTAAFEGTMRFLAKELARLDNQLEDLERQLSAGDISRNGFDTQHATLTTQADSYRQQIRALQDELGPVQ